MLEEMRRQNQLAEEYSKEVISKLHALQLKAGRLGNDSGEMSQIGELMRKFKASEISDKDALESAEQIIYRKEAAIDLSGNNPNTGGH